jgi:hypothetical protein
VSYLTKLRTIWHLYEDEIMVSFIYLSWGAMMQLEMIANTGKPRLTIVTAGMPMAVALFFYGLKYFILWIRNELEMERLHRESSA